MPTSSVSPTLFSPLSRLVMPAQQLSELSPPSQPDKKIPSPLYYLDLNAVAPGTTRSIAASFEPLGAERLRYVDGGIIGSPPKPDPRQQAEKIANPSTQQQHNDGSSWSRPSVVQEAPQSGAHLAAVLNGKHIADEIGTASGLKCCLHH